MNLLKDSDGNVRCRAAEAMSLLSGYWSLAHPLSSIREKGGGVYPTLLSSIKLLILSNIHDQIYG